MADHPPPAAPPTPPSHQHHHQHQHPPYASLYPHDVAAHHHDVGDDEADDIVVGMDEYFRSLPSPSRATNADEEDGDGHDDDDGDGYICRSSDYNVTTTVGGGTYDREQDAGLRAAMATLSNAHNDSGSSHGAEAAAAAPSPGRRHHGAGGADDDDGKDPPEMRRALDPSGVHRTGGTERPTNEKHQEASSRDRSRNLTSLDSMDTSDDDDDVPVAVPVESNDEETAVDATATSVVKPKDEGGGEDEGGDDGAKKKKKKPKRPNSDAAAAAAKKAKKKPGSKPAGQPRHLGPRPGPKPGTTRSGSGSKSHQGGGGASGRSAAAAHRNRQIHVPPMGSPGLLMMPTPAALAVFPSSTMEEDDDVGDEEDAKRKKWLVRGRYLLPSTVFRQSMLAGGYTIEKRRERPHRGSSTERTAGDMFDCDAGGLYLHFPELIPSRVWERRLGDRVVHVKEERPAEQPVARNNGGGSTGKGSGGGGGAGSGGRGGDERRGPKGARSSYIFFTNAQRPIMVKEFPGMKFTEQGVIMGERWRALTPEEKKPFEDMANKDKERHAAEMKEYIESVRQEIREEKEGQFQREGEEQIIRKESPVKKEGKDETRGGDEGGCGAGKAEEPKRQAWPMENAIRGPRLVDIMILGLSKMLGEKVNRRTGVPDPVLSGAEREVTKLESSSSGDWQPESVSSGAEQPAPEPVLSGAEQSGPEPVPPGAEQQGPEPVLSGAEQPYPVLSGGKPGVASPGGDDPAALPRPRHVSPDLTLDELPRFTPSYPRTLERPRPHAPMSFLDMLPISLTSAYPPSYVAARRDYARAVRAREDAIIDSQEAKDDADDAQEKYVSHTEAWERMLEYQKNQIAKREAERKRQREREGSEASERKEMEKKRSEDDGTVAGESSHGVGAADKNEATSVAESTLNDNSKTNSGEGGVSTAANEEKKPSPPTPPPEDPMECMPPRPQQPGPARVVSTPDIPNPPSQPLVVAMKNDDGNHGNNNCQEKSEEAKEVAMRVPKLDDKLLQHLDPSCFLPTMEGRYFGLLSNHISDPQFCGMMAPGIAGTTYGGGTGLATSYVGGGRGAVGLVSGPLRGGNLWEKASSVGSKGGSSEKGDVKRSIIKSECIDETTPSKAEATKPGAPTTAAKGTGEPLSPPKSPSTPSASSAKKKRSATDVSKTSPISAKKKKPKKPTIGLATGDRNTTATEIASGHAGSDFPDGWIIKTYRRNGGETIGKTDRFWFSPGRCIRFRAKKHAKNFVEILSEPNVDGDEDKAAEIYRARGLHF